MGRFQRRLNQTEIDAYDIISQALARRVIVVSIPFIPGGYSGITLGNVIALTGQEPQDGTSALLAHELVHVGQWFELGRSRFVRFYLGQFARGLMKLRSWNQAYLSIDLEIQARSGASDWWRRSDER